MKKNLLKKLTAAALSAALLFGVAVPAPAALAASQKDYKRFTNFVRDVVEDDESFDGHRVYRNGKTVTAEVWSYGLHEVALASRRGDDTAEDIWESYTDAMEDDCEKLAIIMVKNYGITDGHVVIVITDDEDKSRMLARFRDGERTYDFGDYDFDDDDDDDD